MNTTTKALLALAMACAAMSAQAQTITSTNTLPGTTAALVVDIADDGQRVDLVPKGVKPICSPGICAVDLVIDGKSTTFHGKPLGPKEDQGISLLEPADFKRATDAAKEFKVVVQFVTHGNGTFYFSKP
jgi:hypothetical protein